MAEVSQQAGDVIFHHVGNFDEVFQAERSRLIHPGEEEGFSRPGTGQIPEHAEIFLQKVRLIEGFVDLHEFHEAFQGMGWEMFHAAQQEESAALEDLSFLAAQVPIQIPAGCIDRPVDDGDNVVGIMHHVHVGKHELDRPQICRPHIHGNGSKFGSFTPQLFQERNQRRGISALMGMQDGAGFQIEDNGHIVVPLANGKLIDGDVSHSAEFPPLETPGQVILENRFDHVPPDTQQDRDMLDGGNMAQIHDIPLKNLEPPSLPLRKVNRLPQIAATTSTLLKMAMKNHKLFPPPHRERMKRPRDGAVHDQMNPPGMTMSAPPRLSFLTNMIIDGALPKLGPLMMVARQPQSVVQITCRRHGQSPFVLWLGNQHEIYCLGDDFSIPDFAVASPTNHTGPILDASLRPACSLN